jgi:hypothetical protein
MRKAGILFFLVLFLGVYQAWTTREQPHTPGVLVPYEPVQIEASHRDPIKYKGVVIEPLADYSIQARVLSVERYWFGRMAKISPVDLALGWNLMSDTKVLERLNIHQEDRFYFYSWNGEAPAPADDMANQSANIHIIPASEYVEQEIKKVRVGHIVQLKGRLVRVSFPDGTDIKSSLIRTDRGAGACEVMWVESVAIRE